MASEIHAMAPPNNINVNESLVYDILSKDNFHLHEFVNYGENQDYSRYSTSPDNYDYVAPSIPNQEAIKMQFNLIPSPNYKVVNYNNITVKNSDQRGYFKTRENFRTNSPKEYESDESCTSYSSRGTPDNNGPKRRDKTANNQNNLYNRSSVFQPNLYQPIVNYNKNSHNRRYPKNIDVTMRKAHGLMERFKSRAQHMRINPNPPKLLNNGPWDQLNQAIWDVFFAKIQKEDTYIRKLNLWKSIFLFMKKFLDNYGLYLVGSTMSGFALEGSDIDMCLLTKPFLNEPRIDALHHLDYLQQVLLKNGLASEAELIMAKVPILKFKNKEDGFKIDLNCNNSVGIQNTHLLHCYAQLDWRVRPLVVIVKVWAQANHINDAKNMTISSYSWALMVIHYLQCGIFPPLLPCLHDMLPEKFNSHEKHSMDVQEEIEALKKFESDNTSCLGDLLIGFFQYYSYFNYSQYAISVRTGSRLPIDTCKQVKSPKNDPHQWKCLCIEEPFDFSNTARSVFDLDVFKHIKEIIMASYKELARNKTLHHILPVNLNRQR